MDPDMVDPYERWLLEDYVDIPIKIPIKVEGTGDKKVNKIWSAASYNYCRVGTNRYFSWGMGDNYILGNIDEMSEYVPYEIDNLEFIKSDMRGDPVALSLGYNHVCLITSTNGKLCDWDPSVFEEIKKYQPKNGSKKRKKLVPKVVKVIHNKEEEK